MVEFWSWWQHLPQHISPVIFQIGSFKLQYYGLMYIVAFAITYGLVIYRLKHESRFTVSRQQINDLTTVIIVGLMVERGWGMWCSRNLSISSNTRLRSSAFRVFKRHHLHRHSGMSYHGKCRHSDRRLALQKEFHQPARRGGSLHSGHPAGLHLRPSGQLINGELYGRSFTAPIGMYFPLSPDKAAPPCTLYEALSKDLFAVMWSIRWVRAPWRHAGLLPDRIWTVRFFIDSTGNPTPIPGSWWDLLDGPGVARG
jgi:phosphatidylglycerol:prolipoprotein diacylglycerol transferase